MEKNQLDDHKCCGYFFRFGIATQALQQACQNIKEYEYPDSRFSTFRFYMVPTTDGYFGLAVTKGCLSDNPDFVQAYANYHPVYLDMANNTMPFLAKQYGPRLDRWAAEWAKHKDEFYAVAMAQEIVGVSYCFFEGLNRFITALGVDEFIKTVPQEDRVSVDDVNVITKILYDAVMGWKDSFYKMDKDAQKLVFDIYSESYDSRSFPYPVQGNEETKWVQVKEGND